MILLFNENQRRSGRSFGNGKRMDGKTWIRIHPEKTHIGNSAIEGEGSTFLIQIRNRNEMDTKKKYAEIPDRIREETSKVCGKAIEKVVNEINPILR